MAEFQRGVRDEALIKIVHGIKEIRLCLINKAFDSCPQEIS